MISHTDLAIGALLSGFATPGHRARERCEEYRAARRDAVLIALADLERRAGDACTAITNKVLSGSEDVAREFDTIAAVRGAVVEMQDVMTRLEALNDGATPMRAKQEVM